MHWLGLDMPLEHDLLRNTGQPLWVYRRLLEWSSDCTPSMPSTDPSPTLSWPDRLQQRAVLLVTRVINHLVRQEAQAEERLRAHSGKHLSLHVAGRSALLQLSPTGELAPVPTSSLTRPPELRLDLDVSAVLASQWRGQALGLTGVRITGDAEFAQAVSWLLGHLRWDAEDDLAQLLGDLAAHRLVRVGRDVLAQGRRLRRQVEADAKDWLAEAPRALVGRAELTACSVELAQLRDATARLDKRVQLLARRTAPTARN